jgi:hypothetical protein
MSALEINSRLKPSGSFGARSSNTVVKAPRRWKIRNTLCLNFLHGLVAKHIVVQLVKFFPIVTIIGELHIKVRRWHDCAEAEHFLALRRAGDCEGAEAYAKFRTYWEDFGLVSCQVITNNGVAHIVDAFQNTVELEVMNYHGIGTGNTAEAAGDSALVTESTTALNPDNTRATGTQSEPATNQYRSVGTLTADASIAAVEHGLFSQSATGGGVLFDRSVFSVINLASGDSIQTTYTVTFSAGG